ncbi:hypothetical protein EON77_19475, partial [bacterium]
ALRGRDAVHRRHRRDPVRDLRARRHRRHRRHRRELGEPPLRLDPVHARRATGTLLPVLRGGHERERGERLALLDRHPRAPALQPLRGRRRARPGPHELRDLRGRACQHHDSVEHR